MKKFISVSLLLFLYCCIVSNSYATLNPPTQLTPTNNQNNVTIPVSFSWTSSSGATSYRLQVQDNGGIAVLDIYVSNLGYSWADASALTTYHWRVKAVNNSDSSAWTGFWNFTTNLSAPQPPILVSPCSVTNVPVTPLLDWSDVTNASSYRVQVSTDSAFSGISIDVPGLTSSQYQVTSNNQLVNGTRYYWRVNASNGGGTSGWSNICWFNTVPAAPPPPNLIAPPNGAVNVSVTPTMSWSPVNGADYYEIQISTTSGFGTLIYDTSFITATSKVIPAGYLAGNTQYFWHVRSHNVGGYGNWSVTWNFTTQAGPPAPPVLVAPPNGDTTVVRNPLFDWLDAVGQVTSYRIQVSTDPNFGSFIINTTTTLSQYQAGTVLNYFTTYYWHVMATGPGGPSPYSPTWHFRTIPALPLAPILISPPNGQNGVPLNPTLVWHVGQFATSYRVQVSLVSTFTYYIINTTVTDTFYNVPLGNLIGNQTYYWRVQSINASGTSAYSTVWSFHTIQTLTLNLKVLMEGFYNGTTQVQDTLRIYLANATSPYAIVDSSVSYSNPDGTDTVSFQNAPNGNYYIVVHHRNHLETWSALPQNFNTSSIVNYDFTTSSSKAYGNNMKQVGSAWVIYAGDIDQDGSITVADDYGIYRSQFGRDGYLQSDLNGDNLIDGYDLPFLYSNFFVSVSKPTP